MESKKDSSSLPTRVTRGSRGAKTTVSLRTKPEEKTSSENPPKTNTEKKETKNEKKESVSRSPPKGRGKNRTLQHRNRRQGPVNNRRNRLERAQNATKKSENKKNVEKFNNRKYYGMRRRRIGLREIFIAGLPRNVDSRRLFNLLKAFHEEFSAVKKDLSSDTDLNMRVLEKQKLLNLIKARNEELIAQKKKYLKMMTEAKIKKTFSYSSRKKNKEINYDHIYDEINKIFKYIIDNDIESIGEHKTHIHNIQSAQSKSFKALMKMKIIEYSLNYLSIYFKKNDNAKNEEIIKLLEDYIEKEHKRRKAEKYKNERKQKEIELYKQLEEKKDRVIIKPSRKIDDLIFIKNEKKRKEAKIKAKNEKKKEIDIFDFLYDSDEEEEENK